jgi:[ribosomal protein S18]-alanine N-acetyltransferase
MTKADIDEVMAIERLSFSNPWHATTFQGEIENDGISFPLVAVDRAAKRIAGYIMVWKIRDDVQINNVAVHPDFRRTGVAEGMLREVLDWARAAGGAFVSLEVRISNAGARALYEKLGFRLLAVRKDYYTQPVEDALVLGLDL